MNDKTTYSHLTEAQLHQLGNLFEAIPPAELRESLLELFMLCMLHEGGDVPESFNKWVTQFYALIATLKTISN